MKKIIKLIPNIITIARIVMSILFVLNVIGKFVYGKRNTMELIMIFMIVCFSDLLDGRIARKTNSTSMIGAKLDVFADLFFIVLSNITLIVLRILPPWFLGFIFVKFIEFVSTSNFINRHDNLSKNTFVFDKIGRIVSAMFFIVPGITCIFQIILPYKAGDIVNTLLYILLAGGIYSSYSRISSCFRRVSKNTTSNSLYLVKTDDFSIIPREIPSRTTEK